MVAPSLSRGVWKCAQVGFTKIGAFAGPARALLSECQSGFFFSCGVSAIVGFYTVGADARLLKKQLCPSTS